MQALDYPLKGEPPDPDGADSHGGGIAW